MEPMFSVVLTGPAKVNGKWRKVGQTVEVTAEVAMQLVAAKAIAPFDEVEPEFARDQGGDEQVVALVTKLATANERIAQLEHMLEEANRSDQTDASAELAEAKAKITALEGEVEAGKTALAAANASLKQAKAAPAKGKRVAKPKASKEDATKG